MLSLLSSQFPVWQSLIVSIVWTSVTELGSSDQHLFFVSSASPKTTNTSFINNFWSDSYHFINHLMHLIWPELEEVIFNHIAFFLPLANSCSGSSLWCTYVRGRFSIWKHRRDTDSSPKQRLLFPSPKTNRKSNRNFYFTTFFSLVLPSPPCFFPSTPTRKKENNGNKTK